MKQTVRLFKISLAFSLLLMPIALYLAFIYVPNEQFMGAVQRVFYFHVGAAVASYISFAILFFTSLAYLALKTDFFDLMAESAAEVAFVFCTIVLGSGMIWGKAVWGVWFNTEPRLLTFLLLWFLNLSYLVLRRFSDPVAVKTNSAILGIIACFSVPLMVYSIKLLPASKQLHPEVIERGGLDDKMKLALVVSIISVCVLQFLLFSLRVRIGAIKNKLAANTAVSD